MYSYTDLHFTGIIKFVSCVHYYSMRLQITFQLHMARYKFYIVLYCILDVLLIFTVFIFGSADTF